MNIINVSRGRDTSVGLPCFFILHFFTGRELVNEIFTDLSQRVQIFVWYQIVPYYSLDFSMYEPFPCWAGFAQKCSEEFLITGKGILLLIPQNLSAV